MRKEPLPQGDQGQETNKKIEHISPTEEEVFERIVPKFEELRVDPKEFEGVYSREEIERDLKSIEHKKELFDTLSPLMKRAKILEALLAEQMELSDWLGKDVMTIVPSEYDDLYHGVDLAAEFQRDETLQYLALGVDVTTSSSFALETKILLIRGGIESGELTQMKYFTSERLSDFHGRMGNIPSIVVGADARTINELAELWLTIEKSKRPKPGIDAATLEELREHAREAQQKLAHHRIQVLILKQMEIQLEAFGQYAKNKQKNEQASKFDSLLKLVRDILKEKRVSLADERSNDLDDVYQALQKYIAKYF
jgi:hypothetical protein